MAGALATLRGWFGAQPKAVPAKRSQGFAGAAVQRLTASFAQNSLSVNADLDGTLVILRARARSLCANNEWGKRFLSLVAANVIGSAGPKLQCRATNPDGTLDKAANDTVEIHWERWGQTADITGKMDLPMLLRVLAKSVARDGEALVRVIRDRKLPYGIALQLLEADRLVLEINQHLDNGNIVRQGVETDRYGRPVAYYIRADHPGDSYSNAAPKIERVPANDVFHLFLPERAEQVRGYTWLHAVIIRMNMLHGYEEAAVVAARVGAAKVGFFKRSEESAGGGLEQMADAQSGGMMQMSAEAGEFTELPPGYELEQWNPEYPHQNFDGFVNACMRGIASGLDVAAHNLSGNMNEVNYSSARIAEMAERESWKILQNWLISNFMRPLLQDWMQNAFLRGDITFAASGKALPVEKMGRFFDASRFQPRTWDWIDPLKDAQAAKEKIAMGLDSRTRIAASQGREFDDIVAELAQEQVAMEAAGLKQETPTAPQPDPAQPMNEE